MQQPAYPISVGGPQPQAIAVGQPQMQPMSQGGMPIQVLTMPPPDGSMGSMGGPQSFGGGQPLIIGANPPTQSPPGSLGGPLNGGGMAPILMQMQAPSAPGSLVMAPMQSMMPAQPMFMPAQQQPQAPQSAPGAFILPQGQPMGMMMPVASAMPINQAGASPGRVPPGGVRLPAPETGNDDDPESHIVEQPQEGVLHSIRPFDERGKIRGISWTPSQRAKSEFMPPIARLAVRKATLPVAS